MMIADASCRRAADADRARVGSLGVADQTDHGAARSRARRRAHCPELFDRVEQFHVEGVTALGASRAARSE
jgi:hypothetical protein